MRKHARRRFLIMDHTKFDESANIRFNGLELVEGMRYILVVRHPYHRTAARKEIAEHDADVFHKLFAHSGIQFFNNSDQSLFSLDQIIMLSL